MLTNFMKTSSGFSNRHHIPTCFIEISSGFSYRYHICPSQKCLPPVAQLVKNLPATWETWVWSLGWEDPLEKGKATHSSILAWRIPWTMESSGVSKSRTQLSNFHFHFLFMIICTAITYSFSFIILTLLILREIVLMTQMLSIKFTIEQSFGLCGRGKGWDDLREWHGNMYNII